MKTSILDKIAAGRETPQAEYVFALEWFVAYLTEPTVSADKFADTLADLREHRGRTLAEDGKTLHVFPFVRAILASIDRTEVKPSAKVTRSALAAPLSKVGRALAADPAGRILLGQLLRKGPNAPEVSALADDLGNVTPGVASVLDNGYTQEDDPDDPDQENKPTEAEIERARRLKPYWDVLEDLRAAVAVTILKIATSEGTDLGAELFDRHFHGLVAGYIKTDDPAFSMLLRESNLWTEKATAESADILQERCCPPRTRIPRSLYAAAFGAIPHI